MTLKNLSVKDCVILVNLLEKTKTKYIDYISNINVCNRSDEIELELYKKNLNDIEKLLSKIKKSYMENKNK